MVDISIILVNFNTFNFTVNCINSIKENTRNISYEIIVVDNVSNDKDPNDLLLLFPEIKLICNSSNVGFAKANNIGIESANAEVVLLLNTDTYLINNAIELAYNEFVSNKKNGALTVHFTFPDGSFQQSSNQFRTISSCLTYLFKINKFFKKKNMNYLNKQKVAHESDWISGAFFMTKKEVINKLPFQKLHDFYFLYYEDVQWCYSIKKLGYKVSYFPKGEIVHINKGSNSILDEKESYKKKILPSEIIFYNYNKGKIYTLAIFILKALMVFQDNVIMGLKESLFFLKQLKVVITKPSPRK